MSGRDPYPFPRLENDANFVGRRSKERSGDAVPTFSSTSSDDQWTRLNATKTLSSARQEVAIHDPQAPRDSLDFVLKCQYNHSDEFMRSKADTLMQPETIGQEHGRVLKNRPSPCNPVTLEDLPLVDQSPSRKTTIHSCKGLAIESHHSEATNRGYSRKHDGGFYST
ncbi:Uncharacterized protein C1orf194 homolog [Geodia barretti]|uniref:Uncharacterized protein C1orf194 homolog n=1 Tax=Geodia barretti TaxID=519541 RepID=A0AA35TFB8_GEOBA|nr:Uncharacterized protein C1orf194 homolog [Geodia barretti]